MIVHLLFLAACTPGPCDDPSCKAQHSATMDTPRSDSNDTVDSTDDTNTDDSPRHSSDSPTHSGDSTPSTTVAIPVENAYVKFIGEEAYDAWFGIGLGAGGDANADGYPDLVIGMPASDMDSYISGTVYVLLGPDFGSGPVDLSTAAAKMVGTPYGQAGYDLSFVGDTNGDGLDDILVGAQGGSDSTSDAPGHVYLILGPVTGDVDLEHADATFTGEGVVDGQWPWIASDTGEAVGSGDVNGDGYQDLLIGAPFYNSSTGVAYILHGPVRGRLDVSDVDVRVTDLSEDYIGTSMYSPGDTDGDGLDDVLVSGLRVAGPDYGFVLLYTDPPSGELEASDADARISATSYAQRQPFDLNQDGYMDIWGDDPSQADGAVEGGAAYILLSPVTGAVDIHQQAVSRFIGTETWGGTDRGCGADFNGDGQLDAAVPTGSKYVEPNEVHIFLGPLSGTWTLPQSDFVIQGNQGDGIGDPVNAGDLDGDGRDDLLIRGVGDADGGIDAGAVWLFYGASLQ